MQDVCDGEQLLLGDWLQPPVPPTLTEEQFAAAALTGAARFVNAHYVGDIPGMDADDVTAEIVMGTLHRTRRWRPMGKKSVEQYAYGSARWEFLELLRTRRKTDGVDVMDGHVVSLELLAKAV
jgi:DNA-directed RNA polymerase specialized sigma24 family protein